MSSLTIPGFHCPSSASGYEPVTLLFFYWCSFPVRKALWASGEPPPTPNYPMFADCPEKDGSGTLWCVEDLPRRYIRGAQREGKANRGQGCRLKEGSCRKVEHVCRKWVYIDSWNVLIVFSGTDYWERLVQRTKRRPNTFTGYNLNGPLWRNWFSTTQLLFSCKLSEMNIFYIRRQCQELKKWKQFYKKIKQLWSVDQQGVWSFGYLLDHRPSFWSTAAMKDR